METRILTRAEMVQALDIIYKEASTKAKMACLEVVYKDGETKKSIRLFCDDFKTNGSEDTVTSTVVGA